METYRKVRKWGGPLLHLGLILYQLEGGVPVGTSEELRGESRDFTGVLTHQSESPHTGQTVLCALCLYVISSFELGILSDLL